MAWISAVRMDVELRWWRENVLSPIEKAKPTLFSNSEPSVKHRTA